MTAEIGDQGGDVLLKGRAENASPRKSPGTRWDSIKGMSENRFPYSRKTGKLMPCQQGLTEKF